MTNPFSRLEKLIATAGNETKLAEKTKNNATKIASFKEKATEAQTKLDTMMSNTTLVDACAAITSAKEASQAGTFLTHLTCLREYTKILQILKRLLPLLHPHLLLLRQPLPQLQALQAS